MKAQGRYVAILLGTGCALQALLAVLLLLYVNFPPGFNVPYGLSFHSVEIFRTLWDYPVIGIGPNAFGVCAGATLIALWASYLIAVVTVRRSRAANRRQVMRIVVAFAIVYNVTLVIAMPPVFATDVFHYSLFGRMVSAYGLNPYVVTGDAVRNDPFWDLALWRSMTTQYGPVWTLLSAAATWLGGSGRLSTVLMFKGMAACLNLGSAALIYLIARRTPAGDGIVPLLLYSWNPLILLETAGNGHNDVAMIALALLGVLLAIRGRAMAGLAAILLATLVKYLTALLLLFYVIHHLSRQESWRRIVVVAAQFAAVTLIVTLVVYLPFLSGVRDPRQLLGGLTFNPMPNSLRWALRAGAAGFLVKAGFAREALTLSERDIAVAMNIGFAALMIWLTRKVCAADAGWQHLLAPFALASLVYVYLVFGGSFPWYLITPLAALFAAPPSRANRWLLMWSIGLAIGFTLAYAKVLPA